MRVPASSVGTAETRTGETPVRRETTEATSAGGAAPTGEAVVVGSRSQEVRASAERAEAERADKLASIAAALESGTYKVDFAAVAERLVDDELSRSGRS